MKHDSANDVASLQRTTFLQYVGDNTGHNTSTIDGKNTYHGLGSILITNGNFGEISFQRKALPCDKKENWSSITSNQGNPIKSHHHTDTPALRKVLLKPIIGNCSMIQPSFIDLLWNKSYAFKSLPPSWSSYMSKVSSNDVLPKSVVTMLFLTSTCMLQIRMSYIPYFRSYQISPKVLMLLILLLLEAVVGRCFVKKVFLEILQNSQENTCAGVKKRLWGRCFPVNFAKFLRTPFFSDHLWWLLLYCNI